MFRQFAINSITVAFFSVYTIGSLWLSDTLLSKYLPGYVFSGNYKIGISIFFIVSLAYIYWGQWHSWNNWRYYLLGAIAVFFPLVFISSAVNILVNPTSRLIASFSDLYCVSNNRNQVCGKAFAAVVCGMSLRALPSVLTAPALIYFFVIKRQSA